MDRNQQKELDRRLEQARRLALGPHDPLTRERLAELIEELELQIQNQRKVAWGQPFATGIERATTAFIRFITSGSGRPIAAVEHFYQVKTLGLSVEPVVARHQQSLSRLVC
jgi:hypothetical protein